MRPTSRPVAASSPASPPADVVDHIAVEQRINSGRSRRDWTVVLRLEWRRADALSVLIRVSAQPDHPAIPTGQWSVPRDCLRDGIHHRVQIGDILIAPDERVRRVLLQLPAPGRPCFVSAGVATVQAFLDSIDEAAPPAVSAEGLDDVARVLGRRSASRAAPATGADARAPAGHRSAPGQRVPTD